MTHSTAADLPFETIGIVGCGLIGCSVAAALKAGRFPGRLLGCGRPGKNLQTAADRRWVDTIESDLLRAASRCDLIVVCTPVDRIVETVATAAPHCRPGTLLTDVGSTKGSICAAIAGRGLHEATFIGSHPIAGSEKQGCAAACADLFVDHVCVVTPEPTTPLFDVTRVTSFWESLGLSVVRMSPAEHDKALAQTSHVPHVVAAALAASLSPANARLTAGGFQDTTRIAAGDPQLWTAILLANASDVALGIGEVTTQLIAFQEALKRNDGAAITALLQAGKSARDNIPSRQSN